MHRTKIVCTIGPSSDSREVIRQLIKNGMNVARLNFSHGTHAEHQKKINLIREISDEFEQPVAILQDLCGPKIRVGEVMEPGIRLEPGQVFILTSQPVVGGEKRIGVSYSALPQEVKENDRILLADGLMELIVKSKSRTEINCCVITGGILTSHKGINLPTGTIKTPALTEKDEKDLLFGLQNNVDYVALSFVREAAEILKVKKIIENNGKHTPVIAKIEKHEALDNIEGIMEAADGIMVARGDLGVETPLENVPNVQKQLIRSANNKGKPVIVATQMLRSMVDSPRPTRAEATDVANAVLDGTDAVMLSEETASGKYPVEALLYMVKIIESAEKNYPHNKYLKLMTKKNVSESIAYTACVLADHLNATAIVATTSSGSTAKHISRFRPESRLIAISPDKVTLRRLSIYWGCITGFVAEPKSTDEMLDKAVAAALKTHKVVKGDLIVITAGHPVWVSGTTNMLKVRQL